MVSNKSNGRYAIKPKPNLGFINFPRAFERIGTNSIVQDVNFNHEYFKFSIILLKFFSYNGFWRKDESIFPNKPRLEIILNQCSAPNSRRIF